MNNHLRAYFGHHRCASTWIVGITASVCGKIGLKCENFWVSKLFDHDLRRYVEEHNVEFVSYTNAEYQYVRELDNFRGFHVIRDPRDMVVSAYFSHLYSHRTDVWPELIEHRAELKRASKDEGLFLEMRFCEQWFEDLYNWNYSLPNVLEIKLEDLIQDPYQGFVEVFQFLGCLEDRARLREQVIDLSFAVINAIVYKVSGKTRRIVLPRSRMRGITTERLLGIIYNNRFSNKAEGRKPGEEDIQSHYRKGIAGDWMNHFTRDHIEYFKKHYNDVLLKCGYEW